MLSLTVGVRFELTGLLHHNGFQDRAVITISVSNHKADKRTRTVNLLITNQLLCQLSHIGIPSSFKFLPAFHSLPSCFSLSESVTPTGIEPVLPP